MEHNFDCDKCGLCCRSLYLRLDIYMFLDRGDGICKYFVEDKNLCGIYEDRPLICRVKDGYKAFFSDMDYDEYIKMTKRSCQQLKQLNKNHGKLQ